MNSFVQFSVSHYKFVISENIAHISHLHDCKLRKYVELLELYVHTKISIFIETSMTATSCNDKFAYI